jgi:Polyketide cyclase / dehydrase and lipid transport
MSSVALHAKIEVDGPADRVWKIMTDWPRHAEWVPFTRAEGGDGLGSTLDAWTGLGPIGFTDTMVITEWEPPEDERRGRVSVRHTGALVKGEGRFDVQPLAGDRCRVVWAERIDLPLGLLGRLGWVGIAPLSKIMLHTALRRLARLGAQ